MTDRPIELPLRRTARTAGVLYLIIIVSGIFAEFFVRSSLIVPGDASTTASNVLASEGLFRAGIAGDAIMILADVAIALLFYVLLRPVSRSLALLAAFFRLAQAAVLGMNLLNLLVGLQLIKGADYLSVFSTDQLQALGLEFLNAHGTGYTIALTFFGLSILVLGYLVIKADYFPRVLGILLMLASIGYLTDSFANFLMPNYGDYEAVFALAVFAPAFIAELTMCLWLLVKGVSTPREDGNLALRTTQAEGMGA